MQWQFVDDRPIYLQIIEQIEMFVVSGCYQPGTRLPSVRELAAEAGVNPNTMQKALTELERTGLLYAQRTSGRFVTEDQERIQKSKDLLAKRQISRFLSGMAQIGYSQSQTAELILNYKPEGEETDE